MRGAGRARWWRGRRTSPTRGSGGVVLGAGAHADRHHRDQRFVGQAIVLRQVAAQRARAQRHDDVVERAPDGVAHALGVGQRHRRVGEAAVGADGRVPRRARRRRHRQRRWMVDLVVRSAQTAAHEVADRAGDRLGEQVGHHPQAAVARRRGQLAQGPHGEADELLRAPEVLDHRSFEQLAIGRNGLGMPRNRLGVRALLVQVEEGGEHHRSRRSVDRGVVDLRERRRHPTAVDPVDDVQLPERSGAVERAGVDPADDIAELLRRAWRRYCVVTDVEVEIEVGVLDPVRQVEAERHLDEPATERHEQTEALLDEAAGADEELVGAEAGDVEEVERRHVPERAARLHVEERRVHPGELLHGRTLRLRRTARNQPIATRAENRNHCTAYDRCGPSPSDGSAIGSGRSPDSGGSEPVSSTYIGTTSPGSWPARRGMSMR